MFRRAGPARAACVPCCWPAPLRRRPVASDGLLSSNTGRGASRRPAARPAFQVRNDVAGDVSAVGPKFRRPSRRPRNDYSLRGSISSGGGSPRRASPAGMARCSTAARLPAAIPRHVRDDRGAPEPADSRAMCGSPIWLTAVLPWCGTTVGGHLPSGASSISVRRRLQARLRDQGQANVEVALVRRRTCLWSGRADRCRRCLGKTWRQLPVARRPSRFLVAGEAAPRPSVGGRRTAFLANRCLSDGGLKAGKASFPAARGFKIAGRGRAVQSFVEDELKWLKTSVSVGASGGGIVSAHRTLSFGAWRQVFDAERIATTLKLKPVRRFSPEARVQCRYRMMLRLAICTKPQNQGIFSVAKMNGNKGDIMSFIDSPISRCVKPFAKWF